MKDLKKKRSVTLSDNDVSRLFHATRVYSITLAIRKATELLEKHKEIIFPDPFERELQEMKELSDNN